MYDNISLQEKNTIDKWKLVSTIGGLMIVFGLTLNWLVLQ